MRRARLAPFVLSMALALSVMVAHPAEALLGLGSAQPNQGTTAGGTVVDITALDSLLGAVLGVKFGDVDATNVQLVGLFTIRATAPPHVAGTVPIRVRFRLLTLVEIVLTLDNGYTYIGPPGMTGISPTFGPIAGGTPVTIRGSNFRSGGPNAQTPGTMTVFFGAGAATNVVLQNATTLTALTPPGPAGFVDVRVLNGEGEVVTLPGGFRYQGSPPPTITNVSPNTGPQTGGTQIVIIGTGYQPGVTVIICGGAAVVTSVTPTSIVAITPPCASGPTSITVTNPDGGSATVDDIFTYLPTSAPGITTVTPASGPQAGGTVITLAGTGFLPGATVSLCSAAAAVTSIAPTSIVATTPACATAGPTDVRVTNTDGGTAVRGGGFTYTSGGGGGGATPTLTTVTPNNGPSTGGTPVTIVGTNFAAGATLTFGGAAATSVVVINTTTITAVTPAHAAGAVTVVLTNPDSGTANLPNGFTYAAGQSTPTITSITPAQGPTTGGTPFVIIGTGFAAGATVTLGGVAATSVQVSSATTVMGTTGPHAAGAVDVVVRNTDNGQATLPGGFTYGGGGGGGGGPTPGDTDGDELPDECENKFGLDPNSAVGPDGRDGDPDNDGIPNWQECRDGTHPRGFFKRFLAEGATGPFFDMLIALLNANPQQSRTLLRYQTLDSRRPSDYIVVPGDSRRTIIPEENPALAHASFSTIIESDVQVIAERQMLWGGSSNGLALGGHTGSHAETSSAAPQTTWYIAEGATHGNFNLFYLLQNPNTAEAHVEITYLRPTPKPPIVKQYTVRPESRSNVWVDTEGPELEFEEFSAIVRSDIPIMVERVMYSDAPGQIWAAGHGSAAVPEPKTTWLFAEGNTGSFFHTFFLLANPNATDTVVRGTYLLSDGTSFFKDYVLRGRSRLTIGAHADDPRLADAAFSSKFETQDGQGIVAERAMWWPASLPWIESHNSPGVNEAGTRWIVASGEIGGPDTAETYVLVANTSPFNATIVVRALAETGQVVSRTFSVRASSRFNLNMGGFFPEMIGRRFGVDIQSVGANPAQITAEVSVYLSGDGVVWSAGSNAEATRIR